MELKLTKSAGQITMDTSFDLACAQLRNGEYRVTIKRRVERKTNKQMAMLYSWMAMVEVRASVNRDDLLMYYRMRLIPRQVFIEGKAVTLPGDLKALDTVQMARFLTAVRKEVAENYGFNLPLPEDRIYAEFIERYK